MVCHKYASKVFSVTYLYMLTSLFSFPCLTILPARCSKSAGRSSRSGILLSLSPLRTVHESFPSHGSSNSKHLPIQMSASQLTILFVAFIVYKITHYLPIFSLFSYIPLSFSSYLFIAKWTFMFLLVPHIQE